MDHNRFFELIKENNVSGLFLFYGEEEFVKLGALNALISRIDPVARDLNVQEFEKPLSSAVRQASETLPFFAESRLVICREMADSEAMELLPYAPSIPDTTTLILYVRGKCGTSLLNAVKKEGRDVLFDTLSVQEAVKLVQQRMRKRNAQIDPAAARLLVDMVGTDVYALQNELNKAADYAGSAPVTEAAVKACVTPNPEFQRFRMLDAFLFGRQERGLTMLRRLLRDGSETVFGLAHFFTGQFKNMLGARLLFDARTKEFEIGKKLGLSPAPAKAALSGAKRLSAEELRGAVAAFSEIDHLQISGKAPGERALEAAVLRYFCKEHLKQKA
ncbi:MAG TPA: DNA polymerase III subunit delta [Feifaniaceae bacterium]|nr:DNA polymerase III subunit delta [Feifaniaceae bacterium]